MALYLDHHTRTVHDAKSDDSIGAGITKCGRTFVTGSFGFIPDHELNKEREKKPPVEGEEKEPWKECPQCKVENQPSHKYRWRSWRNAMRMTVKRIEESRLAEVVPTAEEIDAELSS